MHVLHPLNNWPNIPLTAIRLWDCGVTWKNLNPSRGVFYFDRLDQLVSLAESKGVKHITLVLGMTPQWAAREPNADHYAPWIGAGSNSAPHTMSDWTDYVKAVTKRYKGRIHAYEIWNEPQLKEFWNYSDYAVLATMTKLAYNEIKKIDRSVTVVSASILPRPSSGGMKRAKKYLKKLKVAGWPVDAIAIHTYPESGKGPARVNSFLKDARRVLWRMRCPVRKNLWITEINFNVPTGPIISPDSQVHWYIDKTNEIFKKHGIDMVHWYGWGHTQPEIFGLTFDKGTEASKAVTKYL